MHCCWEGNRRSGHTSDNIGSPPTGSRPGRGRWSPPHALFVEYGRRVRVSLERLFSFILSCTIVLIGADWKDLRWWLFFPVWSIDADTCFLKAKPWLMQVGWVKKMSEMNESIVHRIMLANNMHVLVLWCWTKCSQVFFLCSWSVVIYAHWVCSGTSHLSFVDVKSKTVERRLAYVVTWWPSSTRILGLFIFH